MSRSIVAAEDEDVAVACEAEAEADADIAPLAAAAAFETPFGLFFKLDRCELIWGCFLGCVLGSMDVLRYWRVSLFVFGFAQHVQQNNGVHHQPHAQSSSNLFCLFVL